MIFGPASFGCLRATKVVAHTYMEGRHTFFFSSAASQLSALPSFAWLPLKSCSCCTDQWFAYRVLWFIRLTLAPWLRSKLIPGFTLFYCSLISIGLGASLAGGGAGAGWAGLDVPKSLFIKIILYSSTSRVDFQALYRIRTRWRPQDFESRSLVAFVMETCLRSSELLWIPRFPQEYHI